MLKNNVNRLFGFLLAAGSLRAQSQPIRRKEITAMRRVVCVRRNGKVYKALPES